MASMDRDSDLVRVRWMEILDAPFVLGSKAMHPYPRNFSMIHVANQITIIRFFFFKIYFLAKKGTSCH